MLLSLIHFIDLTLVSTMEFSDCQMDVCSSSYEQLFYLTHRIDLSVTSIKTIFGSLSFENLIPPSHILPTFHPFHWPGLAFHLVRLHLTPTRIQNIQFNDNHFQSPRSAWRACFQSGSPRVMRNGAQNLEFEVRLALIIPTWNPDSLLSRMVKGKVFDTLVFRLLVL